MTEGNPQLYTKSAEEVAATIAAELRDAAGPNKWQLAEGGILTGATQLFGRLSQIIISRINEMPEQHLRAFLNEAEIDRLPPQPARTEITFLPAPDGPAVIPAPPGTQVATRAAGDQPELIFETERLITVAPAVLKECIVVDPLKYSDRKTQANGEAKGSFPAFVGDTERGRSLYLGDDALFTFADDASRRHGKVTIAFTSAPAPAMVPGDQLDPAQRWVLRWLYWDGKEWRNLTEAGAQIVLDLHWFGRGGTAADQSLVTITNLPALTPVEVDGATSLWLVAQLTGGATRDCLPSLTDIQLTQTIHVPDKCVAKVDAAYAAIQGGKIFVPLNLQSPFQPLGPQPGALDTFYLRIDDALSKEGAQVTIELAIPDLPKELDDTSEIDQLKVVWEYYSNEGWTEVGYSRRGCPVLEKYSFDLTSFDRPTLETNFLTRQKYLEFAVPPTYDDGPLPAPFANERQVKDIYTGKRYVQIPVPDPCKNLDSQLLINGCYTSAKKEREFRDKTCALTATGIVQFRLPRQDEPRRFAKVEVNGQAGYWVRARLAEGSYNVPRSVRRLLGQRIDLPPEVHAPVITGLTVTFAEYDLTLGPRRPQQCRGCVDKRWRDLGRELAAGRTIAPFTGTIEGQALYAGFMPAVEVNGRAAFPPGAWLQLRIEVDEGQQVVETPEVAYEYWNGAAWSELRCVDGTFGLRRTGYVGFYAPDDHTASFEFGQRAYWMRIKPATLAGEIAPRLGAIRLNTVPAVNAKTYRDEVLGSSTGKENQHFSLAHAPVLPDLQLEVLERDVGDDAVHETWVSWTRVDSFYGCGSDSRCYMLDQAGGVVLFGDGHAGKIPPPGIDNIRAARYRIHAGRIGNAAARAVSDLRTTQGALGNVDRVANYETCSGGVDVEVIGQVKRRGPQVLKHRGRAVTQEDIEWLGIETGGVERIYPLAATSPDGSVQAGWITAVIVPSATAELRAGERPTPSPALLRQVRAYLEERVLANLAAAGQAADGLHLCGPEYVEVRVAATVVTHNVEAADEIKLAVMRQLEAFLHPLTGGPQRTGWILGRDVYVSEVAAEIESVRGVDHVATIGLSAPNLQLWRLTLDPVVATYDLPGGSQAGLLDESIKLKLAEPIAKHARTEELAVYAFEAPATAWLIDGVTGMPVSQVQLAAVDARRALVEFAQPMESSPTVGEPALRSLDGRIQLPIQDWQRTRDDSGKLYLTGAVLRMLSPGDRISLMHVQRRSRLQFPVTVQDVRAGDDLARIYVPARYLVCSGSHAIRMVLENEDGNSVAKPG